MIKGNHDHSDAFRMYIAHNKVIETTQYKEMKVAGVNTCLFHFPIASWHRQHHGAWHLYGHSHGTLPPHGKSVDVGVDSPWITGKPEYRPFSFQEIETFMRTREISKEDYHAD